MSGRVYNMEDDEHVYYFAVSPDGNYAAAVFANGALRVMDPGTLETLARGTPGKAYDDLPCTCVKWFPEIQEEDQKKIYRLVSVSSAGGVLGWTWDGAQLLLTKKADEKGNEISSVDILTDGDGFITAGKDRILRIYNPETFKISEELKKGFDEHGIPRPTHVSRIFSIRLLTKTLAASAGWESPVQLWDLRTMRSERQVLGTEGSSDCLEPIPQTTMLVMASTKGDNKLKILDALRGDVLESESKRLSSKLTSSENPSVCRFNPATNNLWCACTSPHKLLVVSFTTGEIKGQMELPSAPLNLMLSTNSREKVYVPCQQGNVVVASLS